MEQTEYIRVMERAINAVKAFNKNGMTVTVVKIREMQTQRQGDKEPKYIIDFESVLRK